MGGSGFTIDDIKKLEPDQASIGVNLYAGPQGSLAGSLPTWIAWFSPVLEYERGSIVYCNIGLLDTDGDGIGDTPGLVREELLPIQDVLGKKMLKEGGRIPASGGGKLVFDGSTVSVSGMGYHTFNSDTLYVKVNDKEGTLTDAQFMDASDGGPRKTKGWYSFKELEDDGWNVGFSAVELDPASSPVLDIRTDQIFLNITDIYSQLPRQDASHAHNMCVFCNAVLKPPTISSTDLSPDQSKLSVTRAMDDALGRAQVAIIPTDKITIGGNVLRNSLEGDAADGQDGMRIVSGDYPPYVITDEYRAEGVEGGNTGIDQADPFHDKLKTNYQPGFHPAYGEGRTSLNAFLSAQYNFGRPMSSSAEIPLWSGSESYTTGEVVRHAYNASDSALPEESRVYKDPVWICIKPSTNNVPPYQGVDEAGVAAMWAHAYWRPYTVTMNQPNSSVSQLWDQYKASRVFIEAPPGAEDENKLGSADNTAAMLVANENPARRRMGDMIGGSRLYGHVTVCPAKKKQTRRYYYRNWCNSERHTSVDFPPEALDDAAWIDLWLFPNNFKKDHGGQVRYAVHFVDKSTYTVIKARKRSFWSRFAFSFFGRSKYKTKGGKFTRDSFLSTFAIGTGGGGSDQELTWKLGKREPGDSVYAGAVAATGGGDWNSAGDANFEPENDIVRFSFGNLIPSWYSRPRGNILEVIGEYAFIIQDLLSGSAIRPQINYTEIKGRSPRSKTDDLGYKFSGPAYGGINEARNLKYRALADNIANARGGAIASGGVDLRLITTQNYFNYLLLGPENPIGSEPMKPIMVWSVDIPKSQFEQITGMIQTGFRNIDLGEIQKTDSTSGWQGLARPVDAWDEVIIDIDDLMPSEFPPWTSGSDYNIGETVSYGDKAYKAQQNISDSTSTPDSSTEWTEVSKAFQIGKDIHQGTDEFLGRLKAGGARYRLKTNHSIVIDVSTWAAMPDTAPGDGTGRRDYERFSDPIIYDQTTSYSGGTPVKYDGKFWFALRRSQGKTPSSSNSDDWKEIVGGSSQIYRVDGLSNALTRAEAWSKILESPRIKETGTNVRAGNEGVVDRKLDFSFVWKESMSVSALSLFFTGWATHLPNWNDKATTQYQVGQVVGFTDNYGQEMIDELEGYRRKTDYSDFKTAAQWATLSSSEQDLYDYFSWADLAPRFMAFRLKKKISGQVGGAIPGCKTDANWRYVSDSNSHDAKEANYYQQGGDYGEAIEWVPGTAVSEGQKVYVKTLAERGSIAMSNHTRSDFYMYYAALDDISAADNTTEPFGSNEGPYSGFDKDWPTGKVTDVYHDIIAKDTEYWECISNFSGGGPVQVVSKLGIVDTMQSYYKSDIWVYAYDLYQNPTDRAVGGVSPLITVSQYSNSQRYAEDFNVLRDFSTASPETVLFNSSKTGSKTILGKLQPEHVLSSIDAGGENSGLWPVGDTLRPDHYFGVDSSTGLGDASGSEIIDDFLITSLQGLGANWRSWLGTGGLFTNTIPDPSGLSAYQSTANYTNGEQVSHLRDSTPSAWGADAWEKVGDQNAGSHSSPGTIPSEWKDVGRVSNVTFTRGHKFNKPTQTPFLRVGLDTTGFNSPSTREKDDIIESDSSSPNEGFPYKTVRHRGIPFPVYMQCLAFISDPAPGESSTVVPDSANQLGLYIAASQREAGNIRGTIHTGDTDGVVMLTASLGTDFMGMNDDGGNSSILNTAAGSKYRTLIDLDDPDVYVKVDSGWNRHDGTTVFPVWPPTDPNGRAAALEGADRIFGGEVEADVADPWSQEKPIIGVCIEGLSQKITLNHEASGSPLSDDPALFSRIATLVYPQFDGPAVTKEIAFLVTKLGSSEDAQINSFCTLSTKAEDLTTFKLDGFRQDGLGYGEDGFLTCTENLGSLLNELMFVWAGDSEEVTVHAHDPASSDHTSDLVYEDFAASNKFGDLDLQVFLGKLEGLTKHMGRQIDAGNVAAGLITQDFSGETDQLDGVGPISSAVTGFKTTVVSQPTFVSTNDMQNFKFAAGSSARTVAQRTSAGNRFYFYSGSPSSQQYHWTAEFPSYEFNDAEWEGHVDCYNTIVPNVQTWIGGSKKTDVDLSSQTPNLGITKGSFPGMTTNSTLKIRIYDDIPDEYNGGIKLISGKALIINPPSIAASGNNPSNLINNRLYFYASDSHTYSLTATFPAITSGSLHNVGRITIDGTNTDGSTNTINATIETSQISGNKITVNLDDGLPFGVGKTRSVASGKNLPYPNPSSDGIWARDAVVLSSPSISIASMTNYKGSKFWVYDNASYTYAGAFAINPAADNANEGDTWKGQSFVKTEGSNVSLSASDYSGTTCTFDFDKSHFSTEGVDTTLTFNDGTLLGSTKGEAAVTKSTKRINLPSILGSSVGGFSGGYQLWPDCPVSVLSGSAVLTTTYNSGSDYDAISLALNDGTAVGIASNNGAAATWNLTSVQVPLLEGATVTLNDNVLSTGGPTTSSTVSIGTLAMEDTPYVETLAIKTIGDANGKNLDFAGFQNRSLSGGRIVASSGLVIRSTYFAPMENMIVPCSKTDAHLSHVKINVLMTEGEGNDRILWDPVRRGYDEPNLWTAVGSADPMELGKQYTTRTGGYAININPGRMATMIFSQGGTKLKVVALDESSVATATHAPGVGYDATATASDGQQGDRTRNRAFWFWSNYLGQTQWEEFGRDSISSSSNSQSSSHSCIWTTIAQERSSNGSPGFWLTTRLMGWRVTAPHKAAKEGFGSAVEYHATGFDEACEQPYILLIPDNSPDWGMLNQQDAWGGGADACGDNGGGFIGMQTHHMSRITKVVNGVFPGVTYRMYISVAMRPPTGQDYSPDSAPNGSHGGPSGCRVHVVEPFLGDSSNDVVKKPLIAYGEFTCNHARSVDYNALNYKGGTGKVTDFCRTDPYEGNTSTGFASQSVENSDEKVNHQGFKLYYVEFTPTKGSTVVEINIEHAFVGNGLGNTVPSSWVKIPQQDFFSSSSTQEVERRDWHDYKGAWCSNDNPLNIDEGVNNDNTVFIGSVFIKMVRPCWVEKVKSKCFATQGGYDLSLSRSSSLNNAAGTVTLKSPDSAYQIIKTLAGAGGFQRTVPANLHDPLVSNAGPGTNGWFESSVEYDLDVISAHTHLYIWDPWAVDGEGRATANSCQAKVYSQTDGTAPTLHTNHYHGHSCFWEKKIWQLKSAHRGGGHNKESSPPQPWPTDPPNDTATSWIPKRPGYPRVGPGVTGRQYYSSITSEWKSTDNFWSWDKHYFAYMPTLATEYNERWTNITDWTGAQLWDDVRDNGGGLTSSPDADWWHTQFSNKDVLGVWHVTDSLRCVPFVEDSSADTDWGLGLPDFGEIDTWRYAGYNAPSLGHLRMSHIDPSGWVEFPLGFASSTSSYNTATSTALGGLLIAKPTAKNAYFRMKLASGNTIWDSDITSKFSSGGYFLVKPHYYPIFAKGVVNFHLFDPRTNTYVGEQPWFLPPPPYEPGWDEADDNNKIFAMSSKYRSGAQRNISPSSRGQSYGDIIRPAFKKDTRHLHGDYHVINHAGLAELYQRCTMHAEADFDSWVYKSPTAFVMSDALGDAGKLSQATTISG